VPRHALVALVAALVSLVPLSALNSPIQVSPIQVGREIAPIPFLEAKPILERLASILPPELRGMPIAEVESTWSEWVSRKNAATRARLERGDEDSIVNFLLFGTTFTTLPRALNDSAKIGGRERAAEIVRGRIADLTAAVASPGTNVRLQFARAVVQRHGIDPATSEGRDQTRDYLRALMTRVVGEVDGYARAIESARGREFAARSTLYRTRGLSSDTSIRPDFAVDRALEALKSNGSLRAGSVRRVGVIGPGLDFTDKAEGLDVYPQQTTQPFAVIDSLLRLGLAQAADLQLTTFDLSPRVNMHLDAARQRARDGQPYIVTLPRDRDERWRSGLTTFWTSFGRTIGAATPVTQSLPDGITARAVRVRPDVVLAIDVRDVNVVVERLVPASDQARFDLMIATNILVYYDVFEQSMALANIAAMLRPGGFLLSNHVLVELPTTPMHAIGDTRTIYSNQADDSDDILWYLRVQPRSD
jgi:hypothetical protein